MAEINPFNQFGDSRREEVLSALNAKLDQKYVKERSQSGIKLFYVEGWHVISEANRIFGADNWSMDFDMIKCVYEHKHKDTVRRNGQQTTIDRWHVSYIAQCRINVAGVVRVDVGSGHGIDVESGKAHESASKEAATDAMKRAFRTFGNPFGLALYDKLQENVAEDATELLISDPMLFEKTIMENVKSGRITPLGLRAILKLSGGVEKPSEIKETRRASVLALLADDEKLKMLNMGKNSRGEQVVEDVEPTKSLEELEAEVKEIMPKSKAE